MPKRNFGRKNTRRTTPRVPRFGQRLYSDSGRLGAQPSQQMPMAHAALSVYGGLVPLGFPHSNFRLTVVFIFYYPSIKIPVWQPQF